MDSTIKKNKATAIFHPLAEHILSRTYANLSAGRISNSTYCACYVSTHGKCVSRIKFTIRHAKSQVSVQFFSFSVFGRRTSQFRNPPTTPRVRSVQCGILGPTRLVLGCPSLRLHHRFYCLPVPSR